MTQEIAFADHSVSLEAALRALAAGIEAAKALGAPMSLVVVDRAGRITASARMDGASALSYDIAFRKAWTSANVGAPTSGVHQFVLSDPAAVLSMPIVANFTLVAGGLPIRLADACVGAVGASGATSDLDLRVAEAALAALG